MHGASGGNVSKGHHGAGGAFWLHTEQCDPGWRNNSGGSVEMGILRE